MERIILRDFPDRVCNVLIAVVANMFPINGIHCSIDVQ